MINKKICIIGAGIGGLAAGTLLTKKGYNVTIYEKESFIGGRGASFDLYNLNPTEYKKLFARFKMNIAFSEPDIKAIFDEGMLDGYKLDLGFHIIGGGILNNFNEILTKEEKNIEFIDSFIGFVEEDKYNFPFLSKLDKIRVAPNIIRLLFASEKKLKEFDKLSISDIIKKYGKGKMKLILEIFSRSITTINNLDLISSGEMLRAQKSLYKGSKPVAYPKKGLESITKNLGEYIKNKGGKIELNTPVEKIIIKNKKATGCIVNGEELFFDSIISNILVQDLFKIAEKSIFPKNYVSYLGKLKFTGSLCAYYSLKDIPKNLIGKTFHFIERDTGLDGNDIVGMIDFMITSPNTGLSPDGDYLVQSYVICTPDEAKNPLVLKKLREYLDKNLNVLIPDFKKHLNWAIYPAVWHLDGVAKTIEKDKPDIKTPIKNLYLVGDCVKAPGIGINCALNSAKILVDDILS